MVCVSLQLRCCSRALARPVSVSVFSRPELQTVQVRLSGGKSGPVFLYLVMAPPAVEEYVCQEGGSYGGDTSSPDRWWLSGLGRSCLALFYRVLLTLRIRSVFSVSLPVYPAASWRLPPTADPPPVPDQCCFQGHRHRREVHRRRRGHGGGGWFGSGDRDGVWQLDHRLRQVGLCRAGSGVVPAPSTKRVRLEELSLGRVSRAWDRSCAALKRSSRGWNLLL